MCPGRSGRPPGRRRGRSGRAGAVRRREDAAWRPGRLSTRRGDVLSSADPAATMRPVSSARVAVLGAVLVALLAMAVAARPPDLRPVMPEPDGVHPVRAILALRTAYAPGGGFLDKYPPLGSFLLGLAVVAGGAPGLRAQAEAIASAPAELRRTALWELRDEIAAALARERWLSRLAMGV